MPNPPKSDIRIADSLRESIRAKHGVDLLSLVTGRRTRAVTSCRRELAHALAAHTQYSLPEIAVWCGYRSHSGVLSVLYRKPAVQKLSQPNRRASKQSSA